MQVIVNGEHREIASSTVDALLTEEGAAQAAKPPAQPEKSSP